MGLRCTSKNQLVTTLLTKSAKLERTPGAVGALPCPAPPVMGAVALPLVAVGAAEGAREGAAVVLGATDGAAVGTVVMPGGRDGCGVGGYVGLPSTAEIAHTAQQKYSSNTVSQSAKETSQPHINNSHESQGTALPTLIFIVSPLRYLLRHVS
jgi:hypothetical protein